jgi:hypothetical protein
VLVGGEVFGEGGGVGLGVSGGGRGGRSVWDGRLVVRDGRPVRQVYGKGICAVSQEERGLVAFEVLPLRGGGEGGAEDGGAGEGVVSCDVAVGGWEGVWYGW